MIDPVQLAKAKMAMARAKQADDDTHWLQNTGSTMFGLGVPTALAGYGSHAVGQLAPRVRVRALADSYNPETQKIIQNYMAGDRAAGTASQAMENHIFGGHRMLSAEPYKGTSSMDLLRRTYDHPVTKFLASKIPGMEMANGFKQHGLEHYGQFAAGPSSALEQLAREMQSEHHYFRGDNVEPIVQAQRKAMQDAVQAAKGAGPNGQQAFRDTYRQRFQDLLSRGEITQRDRDLMQFYPNDEAISKSTLSGEQTKQIRNDVQAARNKLVGFPEAQAVHGDPGRTRSQLDMAKKVQSNPVIQQHVSGEAGGLLDALHGGNDPYARLESAQRNAERAGGLSSRAQEMQRLAQRQGKLEQYKALRGKGVDAKQLAGVLGGSRSGQLGNYYQQFGNDTFADAQKHFDRADQLGQRAGKLQARQQDLGMEPQRLIEDTANATRSTMTQGYHDLRMRQGMIDALAAHPEHAKLVEGLKGKPIHEVNLSSLPTQAQEYAVSHVLKNDPVAKTMSLNYAKHYTGAPQVYGRLGQALTMPGQLAQRVAKPLEMAGKYGKGVGRLGLGMMAAGVPTWMAGRVMTATQPSLRDMMRKNIESQGQLNENISRMVQQHQAPPAPPAPSQSPQQLAQQHAQPVDARGEIRQGVLRTAKNAIGNLWSKITSKYDGGPA